MVPLSICLFVHRVCNDNQFEACSGSDFVNFLNLKPTASPVTVRPKEKLLVCYLISAISATLPTRDVAKDRVAG